MQHCAHTGGKLHFKDRTGNDFGWSDEGVVYSLKAAPLSYEDNYFLDDYEKSYGRSYEDDAGNLRRLARKRLSRLNKVRPQRKTSPGRLLEIGCATGIFLDEARNDGFDVTGIEVSSWACKVAQDRNLRVIRSSIIEPTQEAEDVIQNEQFDVVCAFYVIEHFAGQKKLFTTIRNLLKPGGFFVCALPSTHGPLFYNDIERWIATHPQDHYVDYSPKSLKSILPLYNLRPIDFRPASYHQERCKGILKYLPSPFYKVFADRFAYGDTVEFIAQRTN